MSQINPFTGSILQSPQVQRQQADDRDRVVRRAAEQTKNAGLSDDQIDHQVESSEELTPTNPDEQRERKFKQPTHQGKSGQEEATDENTRLDLTA